MVRPAHFCCLVIVLSVAALLPSLANAEKGKKSDDAPMSEADRLFRLAQENHYGQGRKIDLAEAAALYRQADEKGHLLAAGFLGVLYASGSGVRKDAEKARKLCQ